MGLSDRFNRGATAPKAVTAPTKKNRYVGISARAKQIDHPEPGEYRFECLSFSNQERPSDYALYSRATLRVIESEGVLPSKPDDVVLFMQFFTPAGLQVIRDFLMAANGFDDVEAFDTWAADRSNEEVENVVGKRLLAQVSRGKPDGKGGFYRDWCFASDASDASDEE